jgi:AbiV family abortive infection protein
MPIKARSYELTHDLLRQYRDAAIANAEALLSEAELLLAHRHLARAYFLAVSSIEEIGKSVQAFEGLGKNLRDPAIQQRLKLLFEDHSQKVTYAFMPLLKSVDNLRERVMDFTDIMVAIKFGREAAMYTDINAERIAVISPNMQVCQRAASDCIQLARVVISHARPYALQDQPKTATKAHDALFSMKPSLYNKIMNSEDFWWYYISKVEQGQSAFDANVVEYSRTFLANGKNFKNTATSESTNNCT